ncbi:MAG: hypothetical protein Q7S87_09985 [Agitococcus sp.]|nr:hypothetical protein [Agitococcus sp.]
MISAFNLVYLRHRDHPEIPGQTAEYFRSPEFCEKILTLENDPTEKLRLTLALLTHVALDPVIGATVDKHVNLYPKEGQIWVCLNFNRIVNFIGSFSIEPGTPDALALTEAIEQNLKGKLFKAAVMHRRMDKKVNKHCWRISKFCQAAYAKAMAELNFRPSDNAAWRTSDSYKLKYDIANVTALMERDALSTSLKSRMFARIRAVGNAASDKVVQGEYTDILTSFASRYLAT